MSKANSTHRPGSKAQWLYSLSQSIGASFESVKKWERQGDFEDRLYRFLHVKKSGLPMPGRPQKK